MRKILTAATAIIICAASGCYNSRNGVVREGLWGVAEPSMRQTVVLMEREVARGAATTQDVKIWQDSYDEAKRLVEKDRAYDGVGIP